MKRKSNSKKVSQNTERMLRLVNQILDFRKIQFTHLKVQELEIALLVAEICDNFSDIAIKQNIDFKFTNLVDNQKIWVDPIALRKL
jgi:signal transduction histidine kinase